MEKYSQFTQTCARQFFFFSYFQNPFFELIVFWKNTSHLSGVLMVFTLRITSGYFAKMSSWNKIKVPNYLYSKLHQEYSQYFVTTKLWLGSLCSQVQNYVGSLRGNKVFGGIPTYLADYTGLEHRFEYNSTYYLLISLINQLQRIPPIKGRIKEQIS